MKHTIVVSYIYIYILYIYNIYIQVYYVINIPLQSDEIVNIFSFFPLLHDWCNKGCGMCYPVCGLLHIKEPLLLIGKSNPCDSRGFPLSLSEWSLTICLTPYNRK